MSLPTTMRAWVSGELPGHDHLELKRIPIPNMPEGHLLVAVSGAAINFSDLLMIGDTYQVRPPRPFTPGQEISGVVVAAADDTEYQTGDAVMGKVMLGGFAEYAIARADMMLRVSTATELREAAAIPVSFTTAAVALTESTVLKEGETIMVHAAGGAVGLASVQVAKALGATVVATAGAALKCELALAHGADYAINYQTTDFRKQVLDITKGNGVEVVLDPVGGEVAALSLRSLAWRGRYLIVGFASGTVPQLPSSRLLLKGASAIGVYWNHDVDMPMTRRAEERVLGWLDAGALHPHVDTSFELSDLPRALHALSERQTKGKVVLRVNVGLAS